MERIKSNGKSVDGVACAGLNQIQENATQAFNRQQHR